MKNNFIHDKQKKSMETKGIVIRINPKLLHKIEQDKTPRNELITHALTQYFNNKSTQKENDEEIPIEIYEEIYSNLYNIEISPLRLKINNLKKTISLLETQINELKKDKQFFMDHFNDLIKNQDNHKKLSFLRKRQKVNDKDVDK
jgi:hypothetical protein